MIDNKEMEILTNGLKEIKTNEKWAIYGTGKGAELVWMALERLSLIGVIDIIIDRDEKVQCNKKFQGRTIKKLTEIGNSLDGIIVAAIDNHKVIRERIENNLTEAQLRGIRILDIFEIREIAGKLEYVKYIERTILREKTDFIDFNENGYKYKKTDTKVIAWYLPQFHQIEINNKYHGKGFTEWTNTSRAIPMFSGHYQPHIPYDVGYYDLMNIETLKRQIFLAKHYGIFGFCFHYYWFSGVKLMEKPLEMLLKHKELDMPFCLNWATENWTALWDGGNREIMFEQVLEEKDTSKFMEDILPYMKDSRYIKIKGKPLLIIYRINLFEKEFIKKILHNLRKKAKERGFSDLYIMVTNAFDFEEDVQEWGADAIVEFPPHVIQRLLSDYKPSGYLNPYYNGKIYDVLSFIKERKYMLKHNTKVYFRSALTSWDNTARKATSGGAIFYGFTPNTFKKWLKDIMIESKTIHELSEDIIFVNSWNEWGEGSHLEPDIKYGYSYLQNVKEVIEELRAL